MTTHCDNAEVTELRAEVARLTAALLRAVDQANTDREAHKATVQRLTAALRKSLEHSHEDSKCASCDLVRRALAGHY